MTWPDKPPPSLQDFERYSWQGLKERAVENRRAFQGDSQLQNDHKHYCEGDNDWQYGQTFCRGLIPKPLLDNPNVGGEKPYQKSDTFFTDFDIHNPRELILSRSEHSFIIGNRASHDVRQYTAEWDPSHTDKTTAAGMSYMHLLVIPKERLTNVVSLESTDIIHEMMDHFERFWRSPDAIDAVNKRIKRAVDEREAEVIKGLEKHSSTFPERKKKFDEVMMDVRKYTDECANRLKSSPLSVKDGGIQFRFHATPDASIAHLHMHVLSGPVEYRTYSTDAHDYKSVPAGAIIEIIDAEKHLAARILYFFYDLFRLPASLRYHPVFH